MDTSKRVNTLVLDSGPIIRNDPSISSLIAQAETLITIPAVLSELKDEVTRQRVDTLLKPFLTVRQPSASSVKFVTDFARRTGDLAVLSKPDIQIIALTYELECERNAGDWRLKKAPGQKGLNGPVPGKEVKGAAGGAEEPKAGGEDVVSEPVLAEVASGGMTTEPKIETGNEDSPLPQEEPADQSQAADHSQTQGHVRSTTRRRRRRPKGASTASVSETAETTDNVSNEVQQAAEQEESGPQSESKSGEMEAISEQTIKDAEVDIPIATQNAAEQLEGVSQPESNLHETKPGQVQATEDADVTQEQQQQDLAESLAASSLEDNKSEEPTTSSAENDFAQTQTQDSESSSDSDSEGWITPSNLKKVQASESHNSVAQDNDKTHMQVAVLTTDFAMQNVILQIHLNLLSNNLQRVKFVRSTAMRCQACFLVSKEMDKQFCPRCGKPTLTRVSCSTTASGEFKVHLKKNFQYNSRGDRYSIPKPVHGSSNGRIKGGGKGGWGHELILTEDQKEYERAAREGKRTKERGLMDEDYLPGILTGERRGTGGRIRVGAGRNVNTKKR